MLQVNKFTPTEWNATILTRPYKNIKYGSQASGVMLLSKIPKLFLCVFENTINLNGEHSKTILQTQPEINLNWLLIDPSQVNNTNVDILKPFRTAEEEEALPPLRYHLRAVIVSRFTKDPLTGINHAITYRREWHGHDQQEWWYCNSGFTEEVTRADVMPSQQDPPNGPKSKRTNPERGRDYALVFELADNKHQKEEMKLRDDAEVCPDWRREYEHDWFAGGDIDDPDTQDSFNTSEEAHSKLTYITKNWLPNLSVFQALQGRQTGMANPLDL
ncbi:hypothetical protein ABW19_dt0207367 [Dactylella cylindrospora]|nr:hypothetical protein ABW19_dt0207367 [Dactylella cylindrospora]